MYVTNARSDRLFLSTVMKSVNSQKMLKPCAANSRDGFTLVELLVAIAIIGMLIALVLPAISSAREAARRVQCVNQLRQIGVGLHAYHDAFSTFPPGYVADLANGEDSKSWGWGALLLPFVEQRPLSDRLDANRRSFDAVASDTQRAGFLQSNVDLYLCPSDPGDGRSHRFRSITVSRELDDLRLLTLNASPELSDTQTVLAHVISAPKPPPPNRDLIPVEPNVIPVAIRIAKSNYVGSFGSRWKSERRNWDAKDFQGNGVFGRNSAISTSKIIDGTSKTLAVGERCMRNYAAVWAGGNSWKGCGFADNQMVLGTAFYPINDDPLDQNLDCDGRGSANFSSYHHGGVNFLFAGGSVRFLSQQLRMDIFQKLAQRDDREDVGDF